MAKAIMPPKTEYKQISAGVYPARCYSVIDIGTQKTLFKGEEKLKHKIRVSWEFPTELTVFDEAKWEQPFVLGKEYTLSIFDQSQLRKDLESWMGRWLNQQEEAEWFDTDQLVGMPCQIQIIKVASKKDPWIEFSTINGILSLPKGMKVPDQINESQLINIEDWETEKINTIPEFIQKKIMESEEYKKLNEYPEFMR